ncbi:hypothetical protein QCN29_31755 [Streptomyces sp. HNM0663]|uniref:Uncharacterized protein n=1 Tax=Streptomyces chengmaiensis TaxID=3040919 RepID=A0ABT6HX37_9ACTN|nr:hypothetical protein [Streptomyces chengmaiensis]MDH2393267.1 hypothetical protein [Streptomyces chengmaiensis]
MAAETPSRKRRFRRPKPAAAHQGGTGPSADATASAGHSPAVLPSDGTQNDDGRGRSASLEAARTAGPAADEERPSLVKRGVRASSQGVKTSLAFVADRIVENAPRIPVRDLTTLRAQFPGLTPEQLADKLIAGAAAGTSTVGAGVGAAAMLPVPPAMPAELAAEIVGVAAIELKLIAELYEVYGLRPPGTLKERSAAYLTSWTEERGVDVTKPSTYKNVALGGGLKRELRQQIMKRTVRNLPNLIPFLVGAAVGAAMNRRETKKLAERIRKDLRSRQIPWDALPELPPLEQSALPLPLPAAAPLPREPGR